MAKTIDNKLGENAFVETFNYARKKVMTYAMAGLMLFNSSATVYSAVQAQKAQTKATTQVQTVKPTHKQTQKINYNVKSAEKKIKKSILKSPYFLVGTVLIAGAAYYNQQEEDRKKREQEQNNQVTPPVNPPIDYTKDTNNDGVPDYWCSQYSLDVNTDRRTIDTDNDGAKDNYEFDQRTNPIDNTSYPQDDSHALRVISCNSKAYKAIENKSQLETSLAVNPKNPLNSSVNFMMPAGKNTMIYGNLSKENINVKVVYRY